MLPIPLQLRMRASDHETPVVRTRDSGARPGQGRGFFVSWEGLYSVLLGEWFLMIRIVSWC